MTEKDPRMSTWEIAESLHVDQTSIYRILTDDLEIKNVCSVWVPSELSEKNKEGHIVCCRRILENVSHRVQDELWVNWSIVKSKQQNMTWIKKGGKRSQVVKPKLTVKKSMLLIALTCSPARFSITALPRGVTVTAEYMVEFFKSTGHRFNNLKKDKIRWTTHGLIARLEHRLIWSIRVPPCFPRAPTARI